MNFNLKLINRTALFPLQGLGVNKTNFCSPLGVRGSLLFFLLFFCSYTFAADIYVSPNGKDTNNGSITAPKATVLAALRQAREMRRLKVDGIENGIQIILKGGEYEMYEPLFVRPEDSGTPQSPTTICGAEGEKVILSGGVKINNWKKSGKLWVAYVPDFNGRPLDFRQLYVNGKKAVRARDVADFEKMNRIIGNDKKNQILWTPAKAVKLILKAPYPEMVLHQMWVVSILRIKSIEIHGDSAAIRFHNPENKLQFDRYWPRPSIGDGVNSPFYLTNAIELLDQQGEWFHDIRTNKLYYYPLKGEKIEEAVVPCIETLVQVEGTLDLPVENINFKNISFNHTTWMRPSEKGHVSLQAGMYVTEAYRLDPQIVRGDNNHKLDNQVWLDRAPSAVSVKCSNSVNFENCSFEHLGYSGLDYAIGNKGGKVQNCLFSDIAGNGILVGSVSPPALETHIPYIPHDEREMCDGQQIINNLITNANNEDWGCVGICAGYVSNINIEHNEINDVSYMGISLGWGWNQTVNRMHNNRIYANNIHHYAKHMYDVSAIYTLGSQPKTVISENYIHDIYMPGYVHDPHHWFYLYTDEGSSFITVKNNWIPAEKILKNATGPNNYWENNNEYVNDSIKQNAGISPQFGNLKDKVVIDSTKALQEIPHFAAIELIGTEFNIAKLKELSVLNGVIEPQFYKWQNHLVLYAKMNHVDRFKTILQSVYPTGMINAYNQPFYNFNKFKNCDDKKLAAEWEHIIFTANLIDDPTLQQEYLDEHKTQFEKWPEVSNGFCNADFQQLQVYKNGRQLILVISIPKGTSLDELNPKTTENNPRVDDWNGIMKKYQTGIEGAKPNEVWVQLKKQI